MRRTLTALAALAVAVVVAAPAAATSVTLPDQETCTPSDAWTETVDHQAVVVVEAKWVKGREYRWATEKPGHGWRPYPSERSQWTREVVVEEAWVEVIEHPAVVCPDPDPEPEPDPEPTPEPEPEPVEPQPEPEPAAPAVAVTTAPTFTG